MTSCWKWKNKTQKSEPRKKKKKPLEGSGRADTREHEAQDNTQMPKQTGTLKLGTVSHRGPPWASVSPGASWGHWFLGARKAGKSREEMISQDSTKKTLTKPGKGTQIFKTQIHGIPASFWREEKGHLWQNAQGLIKGLWQELQTCWLQPNTQGSQT